jgi:hypothetical protein
MEKKTTTHEHMMHGEYSERPQHMKLSTRLVLYDDDKGKENSSVVYSPLTGPCGTN